VIKRVRSTSLYHSKQCSACRTDDTGYTVTRLPYDAWLQPEVARTVYECELSVA